MRNASRFIPTGARKLTIKGADAVVYVTNSSKHAGVWAVGYAGKAVRPTFNYSFTTLERFNDYITRWRDGLKASADHKATRKANRDAFAHTLKLGDVLSTCWGYDQTNREFFEVTKVIGKFVEVRELAQESRETGFDQGVCIPVPGHYVGAAERKKVLVNNQLKMSKWGRYASLVEPKVICGAKVYPASNWTAYA